MKKILILVLALVLTVIILFSTAFGCFNFGLNMGACKVVKISHVAMDKLVEDLISDLDNGNEELAKKKLHMVQAIRQNPSYGLNSDDSLIKALDDMNNDPAK